MIEIDTGSLESLHLSHSRCKTTMTLAVVPFIALVEKYVKNRLQLVDMDGVWIVVFLPEGG